MTSPHLAELAHRLGKSHRIAVVGVGDILSPFDRVGMDVAEAIASMQIPGLRVFLSGTVPESFTASIREFRPDHVVFVDAADMGLAPGSIMVIDPGDTQVGLLSPHVLPLSVLMHYVREDTGSMVTLLGVQPDLGRPDRQLSGRSWEYLQQNIASLAEILCNRGGGTS